MLAGILERWRGIQVESYTTGKEVGELIKKPTSRLPLTRGRKSLENRAVLKGGDFPENQSQYVGAIENEAVKFWGPLVVVGRGRSAPRRLLIEEKFPAGNGNGSGNCATRKTTASGRVTLVHNGASEHKEAKRTLIQLLHLASISWLLDLGFGALLRLPWRFRETLGRRVALGFGPV